jgi:poly-beta-1,6-N-acetyl-D-glucosamine synthase
MHMCGDLAVHVPSTSARTSNRAEGADPDPPVTGLTYGLVTPVRDEADNIGRLAEAIAAQTILPTDWVIVDNGSSDDTVAIAEALTAEVPWARVIQIPGERKALRGGPIARAFQAGLDVLESPPDVVVKLDADVSFGEDYFERLLDAFAVDPALGIASGSCFEQDAEGAWQQKFSTGSSARGATRAYRWRCLLDVLPLDEQMGWDGLDATKAGIRGWRTTTLLDLPFRHHRREGERDGTRFRVWLRRGEASHYMGYRPSYLVLRALWNTRREPAALGLIAGFTLAYARRAQRCPDAAVRAQLRREQRLRALPPLRRRELLGE